MPETDQEREHVNNKTVETGGSKSERRRSHTTQWENGTKKSDEVESDDPADKWKRVWVFNREK